MKYWGKSQKQRKADGSLVTDADKASEAYIVDALDKAFPKDGIVGEEGPLRKVPVAFGMWTLLTALARLLTVWHWGPIGLMDTERCITGAFWQPRIGDFWFSHHEEGAFRNAVLIAPSEAPQIKPIIPFTDQAVFTGFNPYLGPANYAL